MGPSHFTLGTVHFLGGFVNSRNACENSEAIQAYSEFLGDKKSEFITICSLIGNERIDGISLSKLQERFRLTEMPTSFQTLMNQLSVSCTHTA
jgi:hypothetical protein